MVPQQRQNCLEPHPQIFMHQKLASSGHIKSCFLNLDTNVCDLNCLLFLTCGKQAFCCLKMYAQFFFFNCMDGSCVQLHFRTMRFFLFNTNKIQRKFHRNNFFSIVNHEIYTVLHFPC